MNKTLLVSWFVILALAHASCSTQWDQQPVATSTLPSDPEPQLAPDPVPDPEAELPTIVPTNSAKIPVTWANLNLSGKLVYSLGGVDENNHHIVQVQSLDLLTGNIAVLYKAVPDAWIYYVSVSPDSEHIVMSYSPPLQSDPQVVQALYEVPLNGSRPPQLLFVPPTREDQYIQAEWSPDGKYIYYTHVNYLASNDPDRMFPIYKIFRIEYPVGESEPELIAEEAYWPRLSADGSRLVYVSLDPTSGEHSLKIADPDGGNAQEVVLSGPYIPHDKEGPFFSPDGKSILFKGNVTGASYQPNWLAKLMGIRVAKADNLPSDWWSVPIGGGEITRLTDLHTSYLYGSLSPDKKHIVSYGRDELFVMNPDGSELTILISGLHRFYGTVNWIP